MNDYWNFSGFNNAGLLTDPTLFEQQKELMRRRQAPQGLLDFASFYGDQNQPRTGPIPVPAGTAAAATGLLPPDYLKAPGSAASAAGAAQAAAQAAPYISSSAPFGYDANGERRTAPQTNRTDAEWAALKKMRDEQGWGNPVDKADFKTALGALISMGVGGPAGMLGFIGRNATHQTESDRALRQYMAENGIVNNPQSTSWNGWGRPPSDLTSAGASLRYSGITPSTPAPALTGVGGQNTYPIGGGYDDYAPSSQAIADAVAAPYSGSTDYSGYSGVTDSDGYTTYY